MKNNPSTNATPENSSPISLVSLKNRRTFVKRLLAAAVAAHLALFLSAFAGGQDQAKSKKSPHKKSQHVSKPEHGPKKDLAAVLRWNQISIDASGLDHTPVAPGENRVFGEQIGPCRAARALAIIHIAMFDAFNAVKGDYESFNDVAVPKGPLDLRAAISQAAHDTLVVLFPSQAAAFHALLAEDLALIKDKKAKANGITLGQRAAAVCLALRTNDGSEVPEPRVGIEHITSDLPGRWRQDPFSLIPLALGAKWSQCKPFVLESASQFRVPPLPAMNSLEYTEAYWEVKLLGGDVLNTPTLRTPEQTHIGIFWAYDGTPSLCAPPRLYNQIALQIADQMGSDAIETARLLTLLNVAMADAGIAIWESKYYYDFWRPVTAIREADPGAGPTGAGDGNADTTGDPSFSPLGAPASNLAGPNFTPPFPAYPSGHAGFGGALFQTLRRFYGTDDIPFTFVSDEFNGVTRANDGSVRALLPRSFSSLSQAEEENFQSRIYLGIHWQFDRASIVQGNQVADYLFDNAFRPLRRKGKDH